MTKVKMSGIKTVDDIACANEVQPGYIGLIFYDGKFRVTANIASKLVFGLRPEIKIIGMFKNHEISDITQVLSAGIIDFVELCGDENDDFIRSLKLRAETKVMKRFTIEGGDDADVLMINNCAADYISLSLRDIVRFPGFTEKLSKPYFVTGDLTADCVGEMLKRFSPLGIDAMMVSEAHSSVRSINSINRQLFKNLCKETEKF